MGENYSNISNETRVDKKSSQNDLYSGGAGLDICIRKKDAPTPVDNRLSPTLSEKSKIKEENGSQRNFNSYIKTSSDGVKAPAATLLGDAPIRIRRTSSLRRWFNSSSTKIGNPFVIKAPSLSFIHNNDQGEHVWNLEMVGDMKDLEPKDISNMTKITKISSKDLRKIQIILEFFKNELLFLFRLSLIGKNFYLPLSKETIISAESNKIIFSNLLQFFQFNKKFVMALADSIKSRTIEQQFSDILFDHFVGVGKDQCIRIWSEFMEGNVIGRDHLKNLINNNIKLKTFIYNAESNPELKKMGIFDIFQTIHKHLAEYPMYIGRFLENTPPVNEYRKKLIDTIDGCKNLINNVNEILRRVQDVQIHDKYSMKIEKCINSEKYSHYFPANMDFQAEKVSGHITVMLKNKKDKKSYILLITTRYIFLFHKQDEKYKLKPVEMISIDTTKKIYIMVIMIRNVEKIVESTQDSSQIILTARNTHDLKYECVLYIDSKEKRKELIAILNKSIIDLKIASFSSLTLGDRSLNSDSCNQKFNLVPEPDIRNYKIIALNKVSNQIIKLATSYNHSLSIIKAKNNNINRSLWQNVLDQMFQLLEESTKETFETKIKIIDDLIEFLRMYSNDLKADCLLNTNNTMETNNISTLIENSSFPHSASVDPIIDNSSPSQQNSYNMERK